VLLYCALQFSMNVARGAYQGLLRDTARAARFLVFSHFEDDVSVRPASALAA
jgi:hypothetical protein